MPWVSPSTQVTGHTVTAAEWNDLVNNFLFQKEVNYTAFTADVTINATTVGTANQIVSSGAITYENVPHMIEFFCPSYAGPSNVDTRIILRDGSTVLGVMGRGWALTNFPAIPISLQCRVTPTAASHTYNIAAWLGAAGTGTMNAGTGGTAGDATTDLPGFIRIFRVPT